MKLLLLTVLISISGCGDNTSTTALTCSIKEGLIVCPDGTSTELPNDGEDGEDGKSCTVVEDIDSAFISCDGNSVKIPYGKDGTDGVKGEDGKDLLPSPYAITDIIDPCGDDPNHFDEIIIKLYDGSYLAYFESGGKRFLTTLDAGKSYQTTDYQKCNFKITPEGKYEEN